MKDFVEKVISEVALAISCSAKTTEKDVTGKGTSEPQYLGNIALPSGYGGYYCQSLPGVHGYRTLGGPSV